MSDFNFIAPKCHFSSATLKTRSLSLNQRIWNSSKIEISAPSAEEEEWTAAYDLEREIRTIFFFTAFCVYSLRPSEWVSKREQSRAPRRKGKLS
jgi:hypothetical protein